MSSQLDLVSHAHQVHLALTCRGDEQALATFLQRLTRFLVKATDELPLDVVGDIDVACEDIKDMQRRLKESGWQNEVKN